MARATTATIVERSGSVADAERAALAAAGSPRISVIVVFLNAAQFLAEAVESVLRQTYANWELLLVDDGSTDASTASARG